MIFLNFSVDLANFWANLRILREIWPLHWKSSTPTTLFSQKLIIFRNEALTSSTRLKIFSSSTLRVFEIHRFQKISCCKFFGHSRCKICENPKTAFRFLPSEHTFLPGADNFQFCCPIEYYKTVNYQLQRKKCSWVTSLLNFRHFANFNVNPLYTAKNLKGDQLWGRLSRNWNGNFPKNLILLLFDM